VHSITVAVYLNFSCPYSKILHNTFLILFSPFVIFSIHHILYPLIFCQPKLFSIYPHIFKDYIELPVPWLALLPLFLQLPGSSVDIQTYIVRAYLIFFSADMLPSIRLQPLVYVFPSISISITTFDTSPMKFSFWKSLSVNQNSNIHSIHYPDTALAHLPRLLVWNKRDALFIQFIEN
jgi:hypothetical protein